MSKLRVHSFSISIDGYGVGPVENPLGVGGLKVFDWFFPTRTWQRMHGSEMARPASTGDMPFDMKRLIFGGFTPIFQTGLERAGAPRERHARTGLNLSPSI